MGSHHISFFSLKSSSETEPLIQCINTALYTYQIYVNISTAQHLRMKDDGNIAICSQHDVKLLGAPRRGTSTFSQPGSVGTQIYPTGRPGVHGEYMVRATQKTIIYF